MKVVKQLEERSEESCESGEAVLLDGCEIKKARQGDNLEIINQTVYLTIKLLHVTEGTFL